MRGAISFKGQEYYTYMDRVFQAIDHIEIDYNWLISHYDCNQYPSSRIPCDSPKDYVWITGKELSAIVRRYRIQFIWGVFSAFEKDVSLDEVLKYDMPYADGYRGFWTGEPSIQHPLAQIEIAPWDSGLVLLFARDDRLVEKFIRSFPNARDLAAFIASGERIW